MQFFLAVIQMIASASSTQPETVATLETQVLTCNLGRHKQGTIHHQKQLWAAFSGKISSNLF